MRRRHLLPLAMLAAPAALLSPSALAAPTKPKKARGLLVNNVTGSLTNTVPNPDTVTAFTGTLRITEFIFNQATNTLSVAGFITGAGVGNNVPFTAPATFSQQGRAASCDILNLDLGPINLNLLGLVVDISPISIDITALRGPGDLLGNLLCALAGLLDPLGPLSQILDIIRRLNQALATRLVTL